MTEQVAVLLANLIIGEEKEKRLVKRTFSLPLFQKWRVIELIHAGIRDLLEWCVVGSPISWRHE